MKILLVTPFLPSPPRFGAERRVDGLARGLARHHEVSLLWFNADDAPVPHTLATHHGYCHEVATTAPRPARARMRRLTQLLSLLSSASFERLQARRADFRRTLTAMLSATPYDVVQFESASVASLLPRPRTALSPIFVLDEHNIEYDLRRRTAASSPPSLRRAYGALEWRKLAREEQRAWREFDAVAVTSERDRELVIEQAPSARCEVIPNGVDSSAFVPGTAIGDPNLVLFFGALNYFPNLDGISEFVKHAWPRILALNPRARLELIGPGAPPAIRALASDSICVRGVVEDIGPHLERAAVVIAPLRSGGGTRLKIIEALAKGKAVVATRLAAEGLSFLDERHLLIADGPAAFGDAVLRALRDPALRARLGAEGRAQVEREYDWSRVVSALEGLYVRARQPRG